MNPHGPLFHSGQDVEVGNVHSLPGRFGQIGTVVAYFRDGGDQKLDEVLVRWRDGTEAHVRAWDLYAVDVDDGRRLHHALANGAA